MFQIQKLGKDRGRALVATAPIPTRSILTITLPDISTLYSAFAGSRCACCYVARTLGNQEQDWFVCPTCDQFVLCPDCLAMLPTTEIAREKRKVWIRLVSTRACELHDAKMKFIEISMEAHRQACMWYNELPPGVREPGQDTDMLRFCLCYGARTKQLGDVELAMSINALDCNTQIQAPSVVEFCNAFAHKIVRTFSSPSRSTSLKTENQKNDRAESGNEICSASGTHSAPTFGVLPSPSSRYLVDADHLRSVLLRIQCNSLGFPFTPDETIGWSVQKTICMANHSCYPNISVVCADHADHREGVLAYLMKTVTAKPCNADQSEEDSFNEILPLLRGCMALKALRDIAVGEEITLSYVDLEKLGNLVEERSQVLFERYRFTCSCPRCLEQRKRPLDEGKG